MKTGTVAMLVVSSLFGMSSGNAATHLKSDSTFNTSGNKLVVDATIGCSGLKMIAAQDGSVLVAGIHGSDSLTIWKLLADGKNDLSFGDAGSYSVSLGSLRPSALNINILLQRDRKIVVMATAERTTIPVNNSESSIALLRLNANGTPDATFNGTGLLIHRPDQAYQFTPLSIAIDSTGSTDKIYVSSLAVENNHADCPIGAGKWCISKYNANGTLDGGFNSSGYLLQSASFIRNVPTQSPMALPLSMKVTSSGKLLIAGAYHVQDSALFMFRLNANGAVDNSFGESGRVSIPITAYAIASSQRTSARILNDESVLFASHTDLYSNGTYDSSLLYLTKCNADGSLATSFGNMGTLSTYYSAEGHHQYAIGANNQILVYWNAGKSATQYMHLKAFSSNGTPDYSFGTKGYEVVEPIKSDAVLYATLYDAGWTKDSKGLFILSRRFDLSNRGHIGVFKYRFQEKGTTATTALNSAGLDVTLRPQPAKDFIELALPGISRATVRLVNAEGRAVYQDLDVPRGNKRIETGTFPRGVYFLYIQDANGAKASRPIILD